jgi:hypothetical protein
MLPNLNQKNVSKKIPNFCRFFGTEYFLSILIFRILAKVRTKKQTDRKDV